MTIIKNKNTGHVHQCGKMSFLIIPVVFVEKYIYCSVFNDLTYIFSDQSPFIIQLKSIYTFILLYCNNKQ